MGELIVVPLEEELKESYLNYAMSVIVGRALPDVRDGLKPVQRRILYAMHEMGNDWNKPYKKSARVVGEVIGKYHPHGDIPVYEALVRMAQDFTMRYPLIDGQGNFGSVDGDAPAAMRYTEVRLARIAHELLADIEKETVEFMPNYDNTLKEPIVLPSKIPNLIINGSSGIAVGMATNIPPHNLSEVIDALLALLKDPNLSNEELMNFIKGPDFPTGASIVGVEGIKKAYTTGKGLIKLRAKYRLEKEKDRLRIVFTELPYQVSKAKIVEKLAELIKNKKLEGISEVRDESDKEGIRIVVEVKKEWSSAPHSLVQQIYQLTPLETTFGIIMLALVQGKPEILTLKDILQHFLNWRKTVILRKTHYELKKAKDRAHILEGFLKALTHIEEIIEIIKKAQSPKDAQEKLRKRFNFTEIQAQEILNLRLQKLTALEREKLNLEYEELKRAISYYEKILSHEPTLLTVIEEELKEIKEKFGDERKTEIIEEGIPFLEEKLPSHEVLILVNEANYFRKLPLDLFSPQKRGGKGSLTFGIDEKLQTAIQVRSDQDLWAFTENGKVYPLKLQKIPYSNKTSKGIHVKNIVSYIDNNIIFLLPIVESGFIVLITEQGIIKKIKVEELKNIKKSGFLVISLRKGDSLRRGIVTSGKDSLIILTKNGQALHFKEEELRVSKKASEGVIGIRLEEKDKVLELLKTEENGVLFTITEKGYGKKTPLSEFKIQRRFGKGLIAHQFNEKTGPLAGGLVLLPKDEVLIFASSGKAIRINEEDIPSQGRATQGVRLISLLPSEYVTGALVIKSKN